MARVKVIDVHQHASATPQQVWALLEDVAGWSTWGPWHETWLERQGDEEPNGIGAIRVLRRGRIVSREQVTAVDPGRRLEYRLLDGLPVRDYAAVVTIDPSPTGGTDIRWRSTFRPLRPTPAWFMRWFLRKVITYIA